MATQRSVDDLARMENLPEDSAEIERLLEGGDEAPGESEARANAESKASEAPKAGDQDQDQDNEAQSAETEEAKQGQAPESDAENAAEDEGKTEPKYTGKGVMPMDRHKRILDNARSREREAREQLEALTQEREADSQQRAKLESRLAALEAHAERTADEAGLGEHSADADNPEDPFGHLRDEFPDELIDSLNAMHTRNQELTQRIEALDQREVEAEQRAAASAKTEVREAIDANPTLADWEASNPAMFRAAGAIDDHLRAQGEWADKPIAARFDKVVEMLQSGQGASRAGKETEAKARAALAGAREAAPTTHSDMAGGQAVAQSEDERLAAASVIDLEKKFETMSPEQQQAYIARYG